MILGELCDLANLALPCRFVWLIHVVLGVRPRVCVQGFQDRALGVSVWGGACAVHRRVFKTKGRNVDPK